MLQVAMQISLQHLDGIVLIQTVKGCVIITKCVAHCGGQIVNKDGSFKFFVYVKIDNKTAKTFLQYTNTLNVKES